MGPARRGETKSGESACCSRHRAGSSASWAWGAEPRPAERPWAATDRQTDRQTDRAVELPPAPGSAAPPRPVRPVPTARRAGLRGCRAALLLLLLLLVAPRGPELCPPRHASQLPVTASVPAGSCGEGRKGPAPLRSASPRPLRPRYPGTCACSGAGR